ncbi:PREDICTED: dymeclin-like, partial [Amphimedon queenslandica]
MATLQLRNSLFILRCISHHVLQSHSEEALLNMFDPPPPPQSLKGSNSTEADDKEGVAIRSGLKILLHGTVMLIGGVPLVPFTYDVLTEAANLSIVLMSGQLLNKDDLFSTSVIINELMDIPLDVSSSLVQSLVSFFISQPIPPPDTLRVQPSGVFSSFASGLLSLVLPQHDILENTSPLALSSLLFLLILVHQHSRGHNPYREALSLICDENESKDKASFQLNFNQLHEAICKQLNTEQTTLFFYQLLHNNLNFASFVFSRSDINTL